MLGFAIVVCNYQGGLHVAAAAWPCTDLLLHMSNCPRLLSKSLQAMLRKSSIFYSVQTHI